MNSFSNESNIHNYKSLAITQDFEELLLIDDFSSEFYMYIAYQKHKKH